jgi:type IX secretion system PorP/SprF family membrane protein
MFCRAQYFQFSQYNFSPLRINPAMVSTSDYAKASLLYRNQNTAGGFRINSNLLNASYPFIDRFGNRWSGIGLSLLHDQAGSTGIVSQEEVGITYAINIRTSKFSTLSVGFKAIYLRRSINLDGFYTASQYLEGHGFVESLDNGETIVNTSHSTMTFSSGMYWHRTDKKGNVLAYGGMSFSDINRPRDEFLKSSNRILPTIVLNGGVKVYSQGLVSVTPDVLITHGSARTVFNTGFVTSYALKQYKKKPDDRIELHSHYVPGRSGILGVQVHKENLSIGLSYDFPLFERNVSNTGALELGIEWRRLVDAKQRAIARRMKKRAGATASVRKSTEEGDKIRSAVRNDSTTTQMAVPVKDPDVLTQDMTTRLKHKQDSVIASARVGDIRHEPLILEKATLRFNFAFNSVELDSDAMRYFDDLAKALIDNPELKLKLVGHTDNVGSAKFNLRLSKERADVIKEYLISKGVSGDRIESSGKGVTEPLNENATEEERAENRRVEMMILYQE